MAGADPLEPDSLAAPGGEPAPANGAAPRAPGGYVFGEVIGRGGLGEVLIAHDVRVGREVAFKRLRAARPSEAEIKRFLREARIQARLDHPAIPPVYDLGLDDDGRPFFTMKRLAGVTLSDLMQSPLENRPRLLRAFVEVCLATEFAHSRGIVHRDLKPTNVMLGDFGDVYVLDWGLARIVGEAVAEVQHSDLDSLDLKETQLLGTPGYMSPEQLQRAAQAGRPADIYALGAILFELLAGEPLHPRGPTALQSTVSGDVVISPGKRRPDRAVPPELDAIVAGMVAMDPAARPTARKVAERVVAFLDGDRDVARRKTLAVDLVWSARAAFHEGRSAEAMMASGRALALDPESAEAAELVGRVILTPPADAPPDLRAALDEHDAQAVRRHARGAVIAYCAFASFLPIVIWNGVYRWDVVLGVFASAGVLATAAWRIYRQPARSIGQMIAYAIGNALLVIAMARLAGPFTFVPALACVVIMSAMAYPTFTTRPWLLVGIVTTGFLVPLGLELAHLVATTWEVRSDELISRPGAVKLEGAPATVMLITGTVAMIVIAGMFAARFYRTGRDAQRQLVVQAWHLGHLLPTAPTPPGRERR